MMGFYVVTCPAGAEAKNHDGRSGLLLESAFVPLHRVSETLYIDFAAIGSERIVLIVPATFESGLTGPFHISVTMDEEFDLNLYK